MDLQPSNPKRQKLSHSGRTADEGTEKFEKIQNDLNYPHPATKDQGQHEVDVCVQGYESTFSWKNCKKFADHAAFVPAPNFTLSHLPEAYREESVFNFVKMWSQLTVKLSIEMTSPERPSDFPFSQHKGQTITRLGSGKVTNVELQTESECPCPECCESKKPHTERYAIWIMTALHVLFDDVEAEKTQVWFDYDNQDNDNPRKLQGLRVVDSNRDGDWCKFECATHDLKFAATLEEILKVMPDLADEIQTRHQGKGAARLAVIASHPHGCAKHVTVGEWDCMKKESSGPFHWTTYKYSTPTCPGSSGAPVWLVGPERMTYSPYYSHVHSKCINQAVGESGAGDVIKRWDYDNSDI